MLYSEKFLSELRSTVKGMLLNGDIADICNVKELLKYSNIEFSDFIKPLFNEDSGGSTPLQRVTDDDINDRALNGILSGIREIDLKNAPEGINSKTLTNTYAVIVHGEVLKPDCDIITATSSSEHNLSDSDGNVPVPKRIKSKTGSNLVTLEPKYLPYFRRESSPGNLEGIVLVFPKSFIIEDLVTGELLYKNNLNVCKLLSLEEYDLISFNLDKDNKLVDIVTEGKAIDYIGKRIIDFAVLKDEDGYYLSTNIHGESLSDCGSSVDPYYIPNSVVEAYDIQEGDYIDLRLNKSDSAPRILSIRHIT